jgi:hypothetical protein
VSSESPHAQPTRRISASAQVHPDAGLIWLQMFQLRLVDQPDLIAVVQVPANETSLGRGRSLL